ncbi:MAG: SRPBCC family protein [Aggregatilineales bacterium]
MARFKQRFVVKAPLRDVWRFHNDPIALKHLTPPPLRVKILAKDEPLGAGRTLKFRLALFGIQPLGATWHAIYDEFNAYREGEMRASFIDRSLSSPFHFWTHHHIFEALPDGTTACTDDVTFHLTPLPGFLGGLIDALVYPSIIFLFLYRQFQMRRLLAKSTNP